MTEGAKDVASMPSKQSEAITRRWEASRLAMIQAGFEAPDDESWGDLTAEPRGVDYLETDIGLHRPDHRVRRWPWPGGQLWHSLSVMATATAQVSRQPRGAVPDRGGAGGRWYPGRMQ